MKITIKNEKDGTTLKVDSSARDIKSLLEELKVNSETVLVARNSEILLPDEPLKEGDEILLLSVISGG